MLHDCLEICQLLLDEQSQVQEEIGIRGANVSSMQINPDFGFGLDTTIAWDTPSNIKTTTIWF